MNRKITPIILIVILMLLNACGKDQERPSYKIDNTHPSLKMKSVPNGLGVNIHFYKGNKNDLTKIKEAGIGLVRMDVSYYEIEREKGIYDFSKHDKLIKDMEELGIRILFIIDYGNKLYNDGLSPNTEESLTAYAKFCAALSKRYVGKDIIWELWNEPNITHFWKPEPNVDDYMRFCKIVVPEIRKNNPNACIIAPATSGFDMEFLETCFSQGLLNLVDGVSVHPYRNPKLSPETAFAEYQFLSLLIDHYKPAKKTIPILSGEWGYSSTVISRELQGNYLARQWLSNLANNIPISIWYDWHDDGKDQKEVEHNFGTVTWDYKEKPSFIAMKTFIEQFKGCTIIGRIGMKSIHDYMILFQKDDVLKIALWSTSEKHNINLGKEIKVLHSVNYLGIELPNSKDSIEISEDPIYLSLGNPNPKWIELIINTKTLSINDIREVIDNISLSRNSLGFSKDLLQSLQSNNPLQINAGLHTLFSIAQKMNNKDALKLYYKILDLDKNTYYSKLAMMEIAKIGSEKSIQKITSYSNRIYLMNEISLYYLNLAYKMVLSKDFQNSEKLLINALKLASPRYAVERLLEKMKLENVNFNQEAIRKLAGVSGFINQWKVIGSFPNRNKIPFPLNDINYFQPVQLDSINLNWQDIKLEGVYSIIPFAKLYGSIESSAYAFTSIKVDKNMPGILKIGSNDGVICWVNGELVHQNIIGRGLTIDEDIVKINLKKGENEILLKVINNGNNWEASVRVCNSYGIPIDLNRY